MQVSEKGFVLQKRHFTSYFGVFYIIEMNNLGLLLFYGKLLEEEPANLGLNRKFITKMYSIAVKFSIDFQIVYVMFDTIWCKVNL